MKRKIVALTLTAVFLLSCLGLAGCGGGLSTEELEKYRELSWEGTELTVSLGTNKSTGCEWTAKPQDDSVIDYSVNRVFHLQTNDGQAVGVVDIGFQGKGPGTATILCTTPVNWDGTGDGYTYTVTVTVNEDGTIESATGE